MNKICDTFFFLTLKYENKFAVSNNYRNDSEEKSKKKKIDINNNI